MICGAVAGGLAADEEEGAVLPRAEETEDEAVLCCPVGSDAAVLPDDVPETADGGVCVCTDGSTCGKKAYTAATQPAAP